jgi:23S rRNA pseudouridine2605 synthase
MTDTPVPTKDKAADDDSKGERIAKRLARAGLCSRREAERWITDGRVSVDGVKLTSPACVVTEDSRIVVDGKPLPEPERTRLWRYHKAAGLVTSHKDPQGRPTVFEKMPEGMPRVISVGRLDLNSEGLLLLTNDGELARRLELPSTGWVRRYRVRVHGEPDLQQLVALERGITIDDVAYGPIKATLDRQQGANAWLTVSLKEGKNREIRRVMDHLGWTVNRLIRIAYGPFQLGLLEPGEADEVPARVLKEQLGGRGMDAKEGPETSVFLTPHQEKVQARERPRRASEPAPAPTTPVRKSKPHADRRRPS